MAHKTSSLIPDDPQTQDLLVRTLAAMFKHQQKNAKSETVSQADSDLAKPTPPKRTEQSGVYTR